MNTQPNKEAVSDPDQPSAEESQRPDIWALAVPSILGNLSYTAVGVVQVKFIATLGAEGLAAVGAGQRIFFAMQAILMAVTAGTTALVARAWGAGDYTEASRVTMASLVLGAAMSLCIGVFGIVFADSIASVFGLDEKTLAMATLNIRWFLVFNVVFAGTFLRSSYKNHMTSTIHVDGVWSVCSQ